MHATRRFAAKLLFGAIWSLPAGAQAPAAPPDLSELLPADTLLLVDLHDAASLYESLRGFSLPLPDDVPAPVRLLPGLFELGVRGATGMSPSDLLATVAPRDAALALIPFDGRPAPVLVSRIDDAAAVRRLLQRLPRGELAFDTSEGVLTVATSRAVLRQLLARRESTAGSLGEREHFTAGRPELRAGSGLRLYADLDAVRRTTGGDTALWDRTEPGARLFLGPLARAIDMASRLDGSLAIEGDEVELTVALDGSAVQPESPASVLLAGGVNARGGPAPPPSAIATLRLDRSLLGYLRDVDHILPRAAAAGVKAGLSTADSLIGRDSLLEDLLPGLGEPWDLFVLARERRSAGDDLWPRIELPALVLVARLETDQARDLLMRGAFLISLISAGERARSGRQPFRLRSRRIGPRTVLVARIPDWRESSVPPTEYDLSPTLLFTETHVILASTEDGAFDMADHLARPEVTVAGDLLEVEGAGVADYLARNRDVLATNAMLNKGVTLREARTETRILESLARALRLELRVTPTADRRTVFTGSLTRTER